MENITDSELLKIAEDWEKKMPINIGIKTAFAAGYKMAERQAKNCTIPDVSQQREQLRAFVDWYNLNRQKNEIMIEYYDIRRYLETLNCG